MTETLPHITVPNDTERSERTENDIHTLRALLECSGVLTGARISECIEILQRMDDETLANGLDYYREKFHAFIGSPQFTYDHFTRVYSFLKPQVDHYLFRYFSKRIQRQFLIDTLYNGIFTEAQIHSFANELSALGGKEQMVLLAKYGEALARVWAPENPLCLRARQEMDFCVSREYCTRFEALFTDTDTKRVQEALPSYFYPFINTTFSGHSKIHPLGQTLLELTGQEWSARGKRRNAFSDILSESLGKNPTESGATVFQKIVGQAPKGPVWFSTIMHVNSLVCVDEDDYVILVSKVGAFSKFGTTDTHDNAVQDNIVFRYTSGVYYPAFATSIAKVCGGVVRSSARTSEQVRATLVHEFQHAHYSMQACSGLQQTCWDDGKKMHVPSSDMSCVYVKHAELIKDEFLAFFLSKSADYAMESLWNGYGADFNPEQLVALHKDLINITRALNNMQCTEHARQLMTAELMHTPWEDFAEAVRRKAEFFAQRKKDIGLVKRKIAATMFGIRGYSHRKYMGKDHVIRQEEWEKVSRDLSSLHAQLEHPGLEYECSANDILALHTKAEEVSGTAERLGHALHCIVTSAAINIPPAVEGKCIDAVLLGARSAGIDIQEDIRSIRKDDSVHSGVVPVSRKVHAHIERAFERLFLGGTTFTLHYLLRDNAPANLLIQVRTSAGRLECIVPQTQC